MARIKPWQIVVFVTAAAAVGASLYFSLSSEEPAHISNEITLVDPTTGELFLAKPGGSKGLVIPGTNPKTGTATLIPALHHDGKWFVNPRYFAAVNKPGVNLSAIVDRESGEVKVVSETPERLK
jgi:hypothetical protein